MSGFAFRYRLSADAPTVERLPFKGGQRLSQGDMLSLVDDHVTLADTGRDPLLGVATESATGSAPKNVIGVITDADAVYGVADGSARVKDGKLDLTGTTGAQGVADGKNGDLAVVVAAADGEETLVRIAAGRHASDGLSGGQLNAAVARAVVRVYRDYLGRGPTKAQAFFRNHILVTVLEDVMTKAEFSLAQSGQADVVLEIRRRFQQAMEKDLVAAVERLTGRRVVAFMSDNHVDPDMSTEIFILDRPIAGERVVASI